MAKTEYSNLIQEYNSKRSKINILLLIQAPIIFILIWKLSNIKLELTLVVTIYFIQLLWFYWVYLIVNLLLADIKLIVNIMSDDDASGNLIKWDVYKNKFHKDQVILISVTLLLGVIAYHIYSKQLLFFIVILGTSINYFIRLLRMKTICLNIVSIYANKIENPFNKFSIKEPIIWGAVLALTYLVTIINILHLSIINYGIAFIVFFSLTALSLSSVALLKQLKSSLEIIDTLRRAEGCIK